MNPKIERFLNKHSIPPEEIKYIIRENGNTAVYTLDDRVVETYLPVKEFREALPVERFLHPNKGIMAAASQIVDVVDGHYLMADGRTFKYRVHNSQMHDNRLLMLGRQFEQLHAAPEEHVVSMESQFSPFDHMPIPTYVVELQMKDDSFSADFIFRYCNQAMLEAEHKTREQVLNKPFFDVIPSADPKRLVVYMDVALNGTSRTITEYDSGRQAMITVTCFQPMPGYCVCMLMDVKPLEIHNEEYSA